MSHEWRDFERVDIDCIVTLSFYVSEFIKNAWFPFASAEGE